ncbi:MAG: CRTAC1 family protein [Candidatus Poribacteria bacterium]|nr:CRTAC1 family protein [Candidatus Poribacteria bacterium]
MRTTAIADFDNDGDVDFLFATESGCRLMSNDRLNRWSDVTAQSGLHNGADTTHLLTNDFDGDGDQDVVALRGLTTPARYYANQGDGTFKPYEWQIGLTATTGTTLDYDNDGDTDLFFPHASIQGGDQRAVLLSNDGMGKFRDASDETGIGSLSIPNFGASVGADLDDDGDTDILVARDGEPPLFLRNDGGNANRWLHITLEGAMANRSGYGAKVEVKAGSHWQKVDYQMVGGGLHATNPRLEFGLGQHETVDFVRILWNNGVLQSELEVPTNQHLVIKEVQRKASSCPILFSWNGERYVFVTDFLGVGGLGFFVAPGVTGAPDPTERVMLERHEIAPKDGEYIFQIMEPMEEIAYLDAARLIAVDHPIGTEVYPDERLALDGNMPTEAVYSYAERRYPIRATDQDGDDALELITKRDRLYPTLKRDPRFLGYLDGNHFLELDFGDLIPSDNRWILNVYGWIEYPYSHIVYGAYQAGIEGYGISIDAKAADGSWVEAMPSVGYPAGMPKNMTIDVTALIREGHTSLRLRTNQEIYYDDIWLSKDVSGSTLRLTTMPPSRATLQHTGYPREYSPDGRLPRLYDYMSLDKTYAFKNMNGAYTRFGDVRELLVAPDDRHVIMGRGEELTLVFDAAGLPPLPAGYTRSFLLDTHGYSKDMDLYTSFPDTVGPLPFRAMSGYPYSPEESYPDTPATRDYQERYQTRRK